MCVQKKTYTLVTDPQENDALDVQAASHPEGYNIEIKVANGWSVSGYYHNQTLKSVTLQKAIQGTIRRKKQ